MEINIFRFILGDLFVTVSSILTENEVRFSKGGASELPSVRHCNQNFCNRVVNIYKGKIEENFKTKILLSFLRQRAIAKVEGGSTSLTSGCALDRKWVKSKVGKLMPH